GADLHHPHMHVVLSCHEVRETVPTSTDQEVTMITTTTRTQAPVVAWEKFEGETFGYNATGRVIVEITKPTTWAGQRVVGWAAKNADGTSVARGQADGLRAAKKAALAALNA